MTRPQKDMLAGIAGGDDPNTLFQIAKLTGKMQGHRCAATLHALYKQGMLQVRTGGGLEISTKGRLSAARIRR